MRLLVVPRWSGSQSSDFYPWLERQAAKIFSSIEIVPLAVPPVIEASLSLLAPLLEEAPSETIVLGHSVGFQAVMRAAAVARRETTLRGFLGVAPWFTVDRPWPEILPWINEPFDYQKTRGLVRHTNVLLSDNDPFTANYEETQRLFEERLGASVTVNSGAKHFNNQEEPAVLQTLLQMAR